MVMNDTLVESLTETQWHQNQAADAPTLLQILGWSAPLMRLL